MTFMHPNPFFLHMTYIHTENELHHYRFLERKRIFDQIYPLFFSISLALTLEMAVMLQKFIVILKMGKHIFRSPRRKSYPCHHATIFILQIYYLYILCVDPSQLKNVFIIFRY
jgi:hypothetical protein